jgi:hypothetical protein
MYSQTYALGWVSTCARPHYLGQVEAPSNYKDPAKIAEYRAREMERRLDDAAGIPILGALMAARIICLGDQVKEGGPPAFAHQSTGKGTTGRALLKWVQDNYNSVGVMYGLGIDQAMAIAAMDAMESNEPPRYWLWHNPTRYKDPYDMLVPHQARKFVNQAGLAEFLLGVELDGKAMLDPAYQCELVKDLVKAGGLPSYYAEVQTG